MASEPDFVSGASGPDNPYDTSATGLGLTPAYLASASASATGGSATASSSFPPGCVSDYAGTGAPAGWVLCDGASYSRTGGTYDALFAAIGTVYGAVDANHFNVPDAQGRVSVGVGTNADVNALGLVEAGGLANANRSPRHNSTNSTTLPNHVHTLTDPGHIHAIQINDTGPASGGFANKISGASNTNTDSATTGLSMGNPTTNPATGGSIGPGGTRPTDTPAFIVLNKIIKL